MDEKNVVATTEENAETKEILDELAAEPAVKKTRVWEVDFLRGFLILFVVWDHFMWDIVYGVNGNYNTGLFKWLYDLGVGYYGGILRETTHDAFVTLFIFLSGVSCSFSRSNGRRAIKMVVFAFAFTAITFAVSSIVGENITVRFDVIHVIALSVALWTGIEWVWGKCTKPWQKNLFGAVMTCIIVAVIVSGSCAKVAHIVVGKPWSTEHSFWFFLFDYSGSKGYSQFFGGDCWPFFPDFGWFLIGAFLGRALYKEKKSLFPSVNPKYVSPLTFCGRHSIWIYFGSQVVMYGLIFLLHGILNIL